MYSIIDIETTGNAYKGQKITELCVLLFDGKRIVDEFTSLVNPEQPISNRITSLTGITNAMVQEAPKFYEIAKEVEELTKDSIFVAHNVNFDYNVIRDEFKSLGFDFKRKKLCTVRLSRKIIPGLSSYSLGNICAAEGIEITARHRAKGDAVATAVLFGRLLSRDHHLTVNSFLNPRSRQASLPPLLDKKVVDSLPETPGVYYFKNLQETVIYVGKANNIKQRVISHFYDKKKRGVTMCLETANITCKETGSELLALLLESSEIKHHYPKFNRAQRKASEAVGLSSYEDQKGIVHLVFNRLKLTTNPIMKFYSVAACRSLLEKICERFDLCPKYCQLQTSVNACFRYQLKQCRGICSGRESVQSYNVRVQKAIESLGLQTENLVIKEKGRNDKEMGFVLILNGIYQGFGYLDKKMKLSTPDAYLSYVQFKKDNKDVQRILKSHLSKKHL